MADQPTPRARRSLPDLSKLYDSIEASNITSDLILTRPEPDLPLAPAGPVENGPVAPDGPAWQLSPELIFAH